MGKTHMGLLDSRDGYIVVHLISTHCMKYHIASNKESLKPQDSRCSRVSVMATCPQLTDLTSSYCAPHSLPFFFLNTSALWPQGLGTCRDSEPVLLQHLRFLLHKPHCPRASPDPSQVWTKPTSTRNQNHGLGGRILLVHRDFGLTQFLFFFF